MKVEEIKKIACLGARTIGHSWTTYFVIKGFPINLYNRSQPRLDEAKGRIRKNLQILAENGVLGEDKI